MASLTYILFTVHQAFKDHKPADLLSDLGSADLTADVDFSLLKRISQREEVLSHGPMTQNEFLHKMGIRQRLDVSIHYNTYAVKMSCGDALKRTDGF